MYSRDSHKRHDKKSTDVSVSSTSHSERSKHKCQSVDVKICGELICGLHEAVSVINDNTALIFSSDASAFIYDRKCCKKRCDVTVNTNCISHGKITDATDLDCECLWLLSVDPESENCDKPCVSLIRAHFDKCTKTVTFIAKYVVPSIGDCKKYIRYEGLTQIDKDEFLLFADTKNCASDHDDEPICGCNRSKCCRKPKFGCGVVYLSIKDHCVKGRNVNIKVDNCKISKSEYASFQISSAFNMGDDVVMVPQHPERICDKAFKVCRQAIKDMQEQFLCSVKKAKKEKKHKDCSDSEDSDDSEDIEDIHLTLNATTIRMTVRNICNVCCNGGFIDTTGLIYKGIESLSINKCGELFGTSVWEDTRDCESKIFTRAVSGKLHN